MTFDVCICTHSPNITVLRQTLEALAQQTLSKDRFRILIVDNASEPRLNPEDFSQVRQAGCEIRLVHEEHLGVAFARIRAMKESAARAIVFVDDDNFLDSRFLENAEQILEKYPDVGCFSGKIKVAPGVIVPKWIVPLMGGLAIRDAGDDPIIDWFHEGWVPWLPVATASMVVTREVIDAFFREHARRPSFTRFGRRGRSGLLSGEDYFIALSAAKADKKCGYFPDLLMWHCLDARRLTFRYMLKLWFSYGVTDVRREVYLGRKPEPFKLHELSQRLLARDLKRENFRARFCYWVYQVIFVTGQAFRMTMDLRLFFR